jgi:hypothetical protein
VKLRIWPTAQRVVANRVAAVIFSSPTSAATAAADITLVHGGVGAVADTVMPARATRRIIRQNLGWAFGYNLLLVPLAAAGILPPALAAPMPPARSPSATRCGCAAATPPSAIPLRDRPLLPPGAASTGASR